MSRLASYSQRDESRRWGVPALLLAGTLGMLLPVAVSAQPAFDADQLLADVTVLAADSMEGRGVGSEGNARARRYLVHAFVRSHLLAYEEGYLQPFSISGRNAASIQGVNVIGYVKGRAVPDTFIVVTAHYDHLGRRNGQIYNGADDNASGTAGLLALADYFSRHPPRHAMLFAALDAEEVGLQGARALLSQLPFPREQIALNVNMDMIGRNEENTLFAVGTFHHPFLKAVLEPVAARSPLQLRFGHDQPGGRAGADWTMSSDHGVFHRAGIPFVYFGVEDHADYHKPTDDVENMDPDFYLRAVSTILDALLVLDDRLGQSSLH